MASDMRHRHADDISWYSDDIGHFVVAAIFELPHRVENAPLYGFEPIKGMGHGTL